jgi:hypothetical protein
VYTSPLTRGVGATCECQRGRSIGGIKKQNMNKKTQENQKKHKIRGGVGKEGK